jgi:ubiquitin C-terminal hydrolase
MSAIHYQTDNSEWHCFYCGGLSKSTRKTVLSKLPHILIVHFKRFDYDPKSYVHIDTFIEYPLIFKVNNEEYAPQLPPAKYELIGVCLKQGSLRGGHAYAYAKHKNGSWYHFDDSSVSSIDPKHVISKHAYILIYRRLDNTEPKNDLHGSNDQSKTKTNVQSSRPILHSTGSPWKVYPNQSNS